MLRVVVVSTSYPFDADDAQGHFVAAEVRRLCESASVTVLAPGRERRPLGAERIVSLGGDDAFGFPGALSRLREKPWRALAAAGFARRAIGWLRREPAPARLIAHFLLPCGVPIASRGLASTGTELEIVVHGSDGRLFAGLAAGQRLVASELLRTNASLRFVSSELHDLVLSALPEPQRRLVGQRSRVEPCAIDTGRVLSRGAARAELGLGPGPIAVIVSRLVASKRVAVALGACARVPNLKTLVIGDGPERRALMQRFPDARFTGQVSRPLALAHIAAADVLVSASRQEGAPTVVREARALGTPVVCLDAGDLQRWAETDPGLHVV
jgi:teichuronic acid biosynthesis glycosyltransferase TuaC